MNDMSVRSWQNTLVQAYVSAVKEENPQAIDMAAHNLAVHVACTGESFAVLKLALKRGGRPGQPEEEKDTATIFWDRMREQGLLHRVDTSDQDYARIPWPVKDCD